MAYELIGQSGLGSVLPQLPCDEWATIQQQINATRFRSVPVTGMWNAQTDAALRSMAAAHGVAAPAGGFSRPLGAIYCAILQKEQSSWMAMSQARTHDLRGLGSYSSNIAALSGAPRMGHANMGRGRRRGMVRGGMSSGSLRGTSLGGTGSLGVGDWSDLFGGGGSGPDPGQGGGTDPAQSSSGSGLSICDPGTHFDFSQGACVDDAPANQPAACDKTGLPCGVNAIYDMSCNCVDLPAAQSAADCPANFWWDGNLKSCIPQCTNTQKLDAASGQCVPICTAPQVWGGGTNGCITPQQFKALPKGYADCPPNTIFDPAANKCVEVCPSGTTFDKVSNSCKKPGGGSIAAKPANQAKVIPVPQPWYAGLASNPLVWAGALIVLGVGVYYATSDDTGGSSDASPSFLAPSPAATTHNGGRRRAISGATMSHDPGSDTSDRGRLEQAPVPCRAAPCPATPPSRCALASRCDPGACARPPCPPGEAGGCAGAAS